MIHRIIFALRHKTLKRVAVTPGDPSTLLLYYKGKSVKMKRLCPHQGATMDYGYFDGDSFCCPWHGCRFSLDKAAPFEAFHPVSGK